MCMRDGPILASNQIGINLVCSRLSSTNTSPGTSTSPGAPSPATVTSASAGTATAHVYYSVSTSILHSRVVDTHALSNLNIGAAKMGKLSICSLHFLS